MKPRNLLTAGIAALLAGSCTSCAALGDLALRQRDEKYAKMFAGDPEAYVRSNVNKGDYSYWAFRGREGEAKMRWIPGITGRLSKTDRVDYVSVGLELNDQTNGAAESFFRRYNLILKKERNEALKRGVKLGAYGKVQRDCR